MFRVPDQNNSRVFNPSRVQRAPRAALFGGVPDEPIVAPTSLTATATSSTTADLAWSWSGDEADIDGFSIERQLSTGGTWSEVATVGAAARTDEDTGLTADTEYDWRVRAFVTGPPEEFSAYSNVASAETVSMEMTFDTSLFSGTTIEISLGTVEGGTVDVTVEWGDGTQNSYTTTGNKSHTYASDGTYNVRITGSLDAYGGSPQEGVDKLTACTSFGNLGLTSLRSAFSDAVNVTALPSTIPETVTNTRSMLLRASSFNDANVVSWDTSNIEVFFATFADTSFNQDISGWDVSSGNTFQSMFSGTPFNQDISGWNTSNAESFNSMFIETPFDQDIGAWNISNLTDAGNMFALGAGLSTANYDALLIGWEGQRPSIQSNVTFDGGNSTYTAGGAAATARNNLIEDFGWTITDGGTA